MVGASGSMYSEKRHPRVSVVVPSYNHARYIAGTLESVLRQTYADYELSILDDASSDDSVERIRAFIAAHPEVDCTLCCHTENQGGVITLNALIQGAKGEYIALINSDDEWMPEKLERQVAFLDANPQVGAVFTQATVITDYGNPLIDSVGFPTDIFTQENRTQGKWLRRFFFDLNCLCHPSILIRRSVYDQVGLYDPRFRQLPDLEMWIRLVKAAQIHVIEEPLVAMRFHPDNTSKVDVRTITRNLNEISFLMTHFFDGVPAEIFVDGFGDLFRDKGARTPESLACEQAFLYFLAAGSTKSLYAHIGLHRLYALLGAEETREVLRFTYHLSYEDFFALDGAKFFDDALIAYRRGNDLEGDDGKPVSGLRQWLGMNKEFLIMRVRNNAALYVPLRKIWRRLKGKTS